MNNHYAIQHLSIDTNPAIAQEAQEKLGNARDPLDILIELEEEMGCSIVQAVTRYRDFVRESRTVNVN